MKKILLVFIGLVLVSCNSLEKYNQAILQPQSIEALHADVDKTYQKLQKNHPRLYQYISKEKLEAKFDSLKNTINQPLTSKQFYKKLAPVVKEIGQGHIGVIPPQERRDKKTRKTYKDKKFNFNTLRYTYVESRLFVDAAKGEDSLLVGAEVLEIDMVRPQDVVNEYNAYIASDGYNTTLFDAFVGSRFQRFYYIENGFQDSIQVTFKQNDSVFSRLFTWKVKNPKSAIKTKDTVAKTPKKKLTKEEKKEQRAIAKKTRKKNYTHDYVTSTGNYNRNFNFIGADSTVAYMKIRGFTSGGSDTFYEQSFKAMDSLKTKELVIDLRDNGGGSLNEINDLYSYLTDQEYVFLNESEITRRTPILNSFMSNTTPNIIKFFAGLLSPIIVTHNLLKTRKRDGTLYYRFKGTKSQEPSEHNFKGTIYVLINGNSFSASSILSTHLKANKRAIFVGQETGGAYNGTVAGLFYNYKLPNSQIIVHIGMMQVEAPYKIDPDGYGVKADVKIIPTVLDREKEIDAALDWILQDVDSKQ
jgi:C-terminal processing protease CtpA/Prc